jgi:hypothetical protein
MRASQIKGKMKATSDYEESSNEESGDDKTESNTATASSSNIRPKPRPAQKSVAETPPSQSKENNKATIDDELDPNIPVQCPSYNCRDIVPMQPSKILADLFRSRNELLQSGKDPAKKDLMRNEYDICMRITAERSRARYHALGKREGWPVRLNLTNLRDRVLMMADNLRPLYNDRSSLDDVLTWEYLVDDVGDHSDKNRAGLVPFSKSHDSQMNQLESVRPG